MMPVFIRYTSPMYCHYRILHTSPFFICICLVLTMAFAQNSQSRSQSQPASTMPTVNISKGDGYRFFSVSSDSPFAQVLQKSKTFVQSTEVLITFLESTYKRTSQSTAKYLCSRNDQNNNNSPAASYRAAVSKFKSYRGFRLENIPAGRKSCISDIHGLIEEEGITTDDLRTAVLDRESVLQGKAQEIVARSIGNWTQPVAGTCFHFSRGLKSCHLRAYVGIRINGTWYLRNLISNDDPCIYKRDGERYHLEELDTVDNSTLRSANMTLAIRPEHGTVHKVVTNSTTLLSRWGGSSVPSSFLPVQLKNNVALEGALQKAESSGLLAADCMMGSNMAILTLPLVINLVPHALISHEQQLRVLVFIILSDILMTLPSFIKGIELMSISKQRFTEVVTRMGDVNDDGDIVAEVWIGWCEVKGNVRQTGILLTGISVIFLVVGITLDIWARQRVITRRREGRKLQDLKVDLAQWERARWMKHEYKPLGEFEWWMQSYIKLQAAQRAQQIKFERWRDESQTGHMV